MSRGGMVPGRRPSTGRPAKGGERIAVRLSAEATAALESLRQQGMTATRAVEHALIAAAAREPAPETRR